MGLAGSQACAEAPAPSPSNYLEAGLLFLVVEQSLLELPRYLLRGEVSSDPSS